MNKIINLVLFCFSLTRIGLDLGSTTIKAVVLDNNGNLPFRALMSMLFQA